MSHRHLARLLIDFESWGYDHRDWKLRTRQRYASTVRSADKWLRLHRGRSITNASHEDLEEYLFSRPPAARTRNNIRVGLMGFFDFLVARHYVSQNLAKSLPRYRQPPDLPKSLTTNQAIRLCRAAKALGPMTESLVLVMLLAGLRRTEARTLQWDQVDLDEGWIRFRAKGSKTIDSPIHPRLASAMRRWRGESGDARWIFPSPRLSDRPISDSYVGTLIRETGSQAGVEGLFPHALRHTFATHLLDTANGNLRTVQEALRHASPQTTAKYTFVRSGKIKTAVYRLDFRGKGP